MNIARYFSRLLFGLLLLSTQFAQAIPIDYELVDLGNNRYQYNYTINNELAQPLDAFLIFFDFAQYDNISLESADAGWDPLFLQTDAASGFDGMLDAMSLSTPIDPGQSLAGFSVSFDWLGGAVFGGQSFLFYDSVSFDTLLEGTTLLTAVSQVPAPGTLFLFVLGFLGLAVQRRTKS